MQVHRSVENLARHMDLVTPLMSEGRELSDLSERAIRIAAGRVHPRADAFPRRLRGPASVSELAGGANHLGQVHG